MDETLYLSSLPVIDQVTGQLCRRQGLGGAEAEDFRSEVRLHFLRDECRVLRRFEGRSSLPTYVNVVIQRLFLDYRNTSWGRWRPSLEAKRRGPLAMLFERLVTCDGWTCDQAAELLRVNYGMDPRDIQSLTEIVRRRVPPRRFVDEQEADGLESREPGADAIVEHAERERAARRLQRALDRARDTLSPQDALILKMRFDDTMPVPVMARALDVDQKRLYRMIDRILARLRATLEAEGISAKDARALSVAEH